MSEAHIVTITRELNLQPFQVSAVADLLADGATIPFIARYRKEATGSLDEVVVAQVRDRLEQLAELQKRRAAILKSLEENGHLTDELKNAVQQADTLSTLEDIYLPYRPKRRTRATAAREKGLEPLAELIFAQNGGNPFAAAERYVDVDKQVNTPDEALAGARDIIAEWVAETSQARDQMRALFATRSSLKSRVATGKEMEGTKYRDYFEWEEPAATAPSHRILAMRRGERDDILNLTVTPPEEEALQTLETLFVKGRGDDAEQVRLAVHDSYKRLLSRAMETEIRLALKARADMEAILVFTGNLRELLMASPLGSKRILAIDPGYRTGGKLVCLDRQGKLLHHDTVFIIGSETRVKQAAETVRDAVLRFRIEAIAVGNGTASRETESFLKTIGLPAEIPIVMVNESGASVYSASEVAREEFPDHDITVRGSVSIGRRLMDPLSELVKIDPKSIGVGQYQHDVDPTALKKSLDDTVISCVNGVGVDLNQASRQLLTYVSGLGPALAQNIVQYRDANGSFKTRTQLRDVPRLGPKAFEQCAGFLRIKDGPQPLDGSAVHPESYPVVDAMAAELDCTVDDLMKNEALRRRIDLSRYVTDAVGLPTLKDILEELSKPGRDPRDPFEAFAFADGIEDIKHLREGMQLPGIVTNVTRFGAFVDIGVHQDGLVHISQLADRYVKDPAHVVKVNQKVTVTVLEVDLDRRRIALSLKQKQSQEVRKPNRKPKPQKPVQAGTPTKKAEHPFNNPFADLLNQ